MNVTDHFFNQVAINPNKVAIIDQNFKFTFKEFGEEVDKQVQYFLSKKINKGDRVLVVIPMSKDLYRIILALLKIGAVPVFLDEWISFSRLNACCKISNCKAFISNLKFKLLGWFSEGIRNIPIHLGMSYKHINQSFPIPTTISEDAALITFTTGSTGIPKAAIRTHGILNAQLTALINEIQFPTQCICVTTLPIVLLINLAVGNTSIITSYKNTKNQNKQIPKMINLINHFSVNTIIASPIFFQNLARQLYQNNDKITTINAIYTGGAPLFPSNAKYILEAFATLENAKVIYGSTEAEPISSIPFRDLIHSSNEHDQNGLSVGMINENVNLKIIPIVNEPIQINELNESWDDFELKDGFVGEIIVEGNHVVKNYLHNQEAENENKIKVNNKIWHRTGDAGYLKGSELFLVGRHNQIIHSKNKTYYPFIIENKLQQIENIEIGTLLECDGKIILILELKERKRLEETLVAIKNLKLEFTNIKVLKKIPRDPRHRSKIDYQKCKTLV